ncbi:MAG: hypothetical protein ABI787_12590 [Spartobacteria bacterium]
MLALLLDHGVGPIETAEDDEEPNRFRTDPEAPVLRAQEMSHSLKAHPEQRQGIGIRTGAIGAPKKLLADLAPKDTRW